MYRASSGTQLRPMHKALSHGPKQPQFRKERRPERHGVLDKTPPRHRHDSQPSRSSTPPQLRNQILRVATEAFDDIEVDDAPQQTSPLPPSPCTPPFPPPEQDDHDHEQEQPQQLQDDHGPTIQDVMEHEAMTALISSCKQQLDIC